jgi:hypothetical protein
MKKILLSSVIMISLSSCSPFGGQSLIESLGSSIVKLFTGKSSSEVVSGSTQVLDTNPSLPAQNYKITVSVGGQIAQDSFETTDGYKVYTSVQGSTAE